MTSTGSILGPAHQGYIYQDQATSYFFAASLLGYFDEVTVDLKAVDDDRFDDLAVRQNSRRVRRQFKSSDNPGLAFDLKDLTTTKRKLRIDHLVRSYKLAGVGAADEYRVCVTWLTPTDPDFLSLLEPIKAEPSFPGHPSKTFRLRDETIWPDGRAPLWLPLQNATDITRQEFLNFSERFVIELECPLASRDFSKPGQLETLILNLLTDSIGIGRYPNQNRAPVDVAARLQQFAARMRAESETVKAADVERELQLQKDFGRVAQQFPVEPAVIVRRGLLRQYLILQLGAKRVLVTGPPGSGKSWELTGLAGDLANDGYLVARHYCYLEPGDQQVQRRITTNVMFANLIYDLVRANPRLEQIHRPAYSAGPRELEDLLRKGLEQGLIEKAALIVDGIDHVSRVFAESAGVAEDEIDIVEELAALDLPDEVCLIIGSQPGAHLTPLQEGAITVPMPAWLLGEVAALSKRLGVPSALRAAGFGGDVKEYLKQLHERSEGNPLYATFLCRQTLKRIAKGDVFDPVAELRDVPLTDGDVSRYYSYLLRGAEAGDATGTVAELLGLVDFALTEEELKEIHPWMGHRIESAVSHLAPILVPGWAHGGIRIYHESFRRFIKQRLQDRGGATEDVLGPVIDWLKRRPFFGDSRTYKFLLPTLRRAGKHAELLDMVGADFVSLSVEAGHSEAAVEENLMLATCVAAEELNWGALMRCVELHKSCTVCFQDKLIDYGPYGHAFIAVYGAAALAERMLFDERPTFTANQGLIFCSLCDDAGVVPPWEQYLSLAEKKSDDGYAGRNSEWVKYAVAEVHGAIRLDGVEAVYERVISWLGHTSDPHPEYFRGILKRLVQFGGIEILERMLNEVRMSPETEGLVRVEIAHALLIAGSVAGAAEAATQAVKQSSSSCVAIECLAMGADRTEVAKRCPRLDRVGAGLQEDRYHPDEADVKLWVDGVKIAAATDPAKLVAAESSIRGEGWYKNWLRFVISLGRAEELFGSDAGSAEAVLMEAFHLLASDTARFKGKPRACDAYSVKGIIHQTFARALHLINTPANFETALGCLAEVSRGTATSLQNSPMGPLTSEDFIELLMPFVRDVEFKSAALVEMIRQHQRIKEGDELYDTVADADMLLVRAMAESGDADAAKRLWRSASIHLCAYGFRREVSIFDLIDGAAALSKVDNARAARLLAAAQPLVNAVDAHTDGKETQYAPARWAGAVSEVNPVDGAYILGRSLIKHGGAIDWRYEGAVHGAIDAARDEGDPSLLAFLDTTLPFSGNDTALEKKISTIARLIGENAELGARMLRVLAAKVHGDPQHPSGGAYRKVQLFADSVGVTLSAPAVNAEAGQKEDSSYSSKSDRFASFRDNPIFPVNVTPLELMAAIRSAQRSMGEAEANHDRLVNAFGYRLVEMLGRGEEDEAVRLIRSFARETYFWEGATPLADLAEGLEWQDYTRAAAVAFSLAYARSRGRRGNLYLGDENQLPWLIKASALSQEIALRSLAEEVAYLLNHQRIYLGITRHLIKALAVQVTTREAAFEAWQAAFEVMRHRLPGNEADYFIFEKYDPATIPAWSVNEALVFLLLARMCHPELSRKISATAGLAYAISTTTEVISRPLQRYLTEDSPVSSALLSLQILLMTEESPYAISVAIQEKLRALYGSGLFGLRVMAQMLLERASLSIGDARKRITLTAEPVPPRKREAILSLDWGARIQNIGRNWPAFSDILAGMFHRAWEASKAQKEKSNSRHEAARSRVYENLPPTDLLFWEEEMFETLFHEALEGIDVHLWETGAWKPDFFPWLLDKVLPRLPLHLARWYSRVPRPPLPFPRELRSSVSAAYTITGEGEFDGWYRCGYFETEIIIRDSFRVDEEMRVMSSIHFPERPEDANPLFGPLEEGDAKTWLVRQDGSIIMPPRLRGPIAGIDFVRDWLGGFPVLMLERHIQGMLRLSPRATSDDRLELLDESGDVAVVMRYWTERPVGDSINEEVPRYQGCDLVMRPDVFARMKGMSDRDPVVVTYGSSEEERGDKQPAAAGPAANGEGVVLVEM